jgi:SAM-dependent methyltransferase
MPTYVDYAEYYDLNHDIDFDIEFFLGYARQCGSPVLELACGTGRLLVPLAEAGFEIHGLDFSENMLAVCRRKVAERGLGDRVTITYGDMATFDLPRRDFSLAFIAARSFMHLYTQADQIACLRRVYEHLRPGGILIIDVYAPSYAIMAKEPEGPFIERHKFDLPNGNSVIRKDRFISNDPAMQIQHYQIRFEEYDPAGELLHERTLPIDTRYTFRYEMGLLLEKASFEVLDFFRDFEKNPFDGTGEIISVSRKPEEKPVLFSSNTVD